MDVTGTVQGILAAAGIRADVNTFLILYGLCLARLAAVITLAPFFGGPSAPAQVKLGFAAILAAVLYPTITSAGTPAGGIPGPISPLLFMALLIKEGLLGALIGLMAQILFYGVQMSGTLIDSQRGANQMNFLAPQLAGPASVLGQLQFQTALVLFVTIDGHLLFLRGLHASFATIPILSMPQARGGLAPVMEQVIHLTADSIAIALTLSAPVLLALFLVDASFGVLGRVVSQFQIHGESQPVKAMAGLAVLLLSVGLVFDRFLDFIAQSLASVLALIRALA
ncbi:MAG: flagellar biosynthetic protein FliR [Bryobacteraceae bacterium]